MTFANILAEVYRRCGFASSPTSDTVTRIKAFVNEVQQDIIGEPGMEFLLNDTVTVASVASTQQYALPPVTEKIKNVWETSNKRKLDPMALNTYRELYPDPSAVTGIPLWYVDLGYGAVSQQPSAAGTMYVISTSASDGAGVTVYLEGFRTGGYPFTFSIAMNGITAVNTSATFTDILSITKFYTSANAAGTITLRETSGSGTVLATIPVGSSYSRYRMMALAPTPASAITYNVEIERIVTDMVQDTDQPVLPVRFHRILAIGARAKEMEKQDQQGRYQAAMLEYRQLLKTLKYWVYSQTVGTPNTRGPQHQQDVARLRLTAY